MKIVRFFTMKYIIIDLFFFVFRKSQKPFALKIINKAKVKGKVRTYIQLLNVYFQNKTGNKYDRIPDPNIELNSF